MARCIRCRSSAHCSRHASIRLTHRDKLHPSMWLNQHIHNYYRPTKLPKRLCLKSCFMWTNETINIWSHIAGFFYFSYCQFTVWHAVSSLGGHVTDHAVMALSCLGAQVCMLLSAAYHTFGCRSPSERARWLTLDVFGISAGLLGMYLSGIYTSFFCFKEHLDTYLHSLLLLFAVTAYVPVKRDFFDKKIIGSRFGLLHIIYMCLVGFGIGPTIHWVTLNGGLASEHVREWLPSIFILYSLIAVAFAFFISMFPERCSPGRFDLVGCSHQWWHILILAAMVHWQWSGLALLTHYRTHPELCAARSLVNSGGNITITV